MMQMQNRLMPSEIELIDKKKLNNLEDYHIIGITYDNNILTTYNYCKQAAMARINLIILVLFKGSNNYTTAQTTAYDLLTHPTVKSLEPLCLASKINNLIKNSHNEESIRLVDIIKDFTVYNYTSNQAIRAPEVYYTQRVPTGANA